MKLLDYMKLHHASDSDIALAVGTVSPAAVKKWKYGETSPRLPELVKLVELTNGAVTPNDFMPSPPWKEETAA